ncbi:MAG: hypothetical protein JW829_16140, partial [Pirellulales bacterium]|nr:hypothetical protein [Pirellulales bacterium]
VVLDENVSSELMRRFPVVLLSNTGILSDREVAILSDYVQAGGKLIVTGLCGCYDHLGHFQKKSSLETLIGGRLVRKLDSMDHWVQFAPTESNAGKAITEGISHARPIAFGTGKTESVPFLVKGPAAVFEPTTAETVGQLFAPYRTTRQRENKEGTEWPMSAEAPVGPAILIHHVGKGTVLTFACAPDYATGSEHHIVEARRLLANAVRFLHPEPRVRVTAPTTVEAVVTDDSVTRMLRVHLLGYNAPPQTTPPNNRPYVLPATIEDVPTFRATVELDCPVKDASGHSAATEVKWHGGRIEATVHDIHEVLVARY